MARCAQCAATWVFVEAQNLQDSALDALLTDLAEKAVDLGRCYSDPHQLMTGSDVTPSLNWHADKANAVDAIKQEIHSYVSANYEKED